jgi:hypothetical protein
VEHQTKARPQSSFDVPLERTHSAASFNALPELHRYLRRMPRSIALAVTDNSSAALRMFLKP